MIDWPKNIAYGVAVFPIGRTAICAAAVLLVSLPPRPRVGWALAAASILAAALWVWRSACWDPWNNSLGGAWAGLGLSATGLIMAALGARGPRGCAGSSPNAREKQPISTC
jgi:hypothetical protein